MDLSQRNADFSQGYFEVHGKVVNFYLQFLIYNPSTWTQIHKQF